MLLASCSTSESNDKSEQENQDSNKEEKVSKTDSKSEEKSEEKEEPKQQENVVYGDLTLSDHKEQGAYYDEATQTKYILGEGNTIIKVINKSNDDVSPVEFMQKDAKKVDEFSDGVYKYYSKSTDKYYKVIEKKNPNKNILIVTKYN
ncbi:hypothetical protein [Mammaliicoccus lentus]|uniref:hypothetical protein n=1 Tax=Mammaliicoccus lentus TaxID=42858 RepID=UPI001072635C|nr:hypothetical protein [Mammaliicoccus lentus]MBF0795472.1 hypothetical protein [Mammaliicoccus lentus]TFV14146.1 hypothetical protein E4T78_12450 [Mammaliicoccus lentus]